MKEDGLEEGSVHGGKKLEVRFRGGSSFCSDEIDSVKLMVGVIHIEEA